MVRKVIVEGVLGVLLVGLLVGGIAAFRAYRQPLAPPMTLMLDEAAATATPAPAGGGGSCGRSGSMLILVIGRDDYFWEYPPGADAIRYLKANFDEQRVTVFAFQRDLWLKTPSLKAPYQFEEHRLGPIYTDILDIEKGIPFVEANLKATNAIAQTLVDNFGVAPEHYFTMDEGVMWNVIDVLGGVEVDVPYAVNRPDLDLYLRAGRQRIDGRTAQMYMRYLRSAQEEWDRVNRQNVVMKGLLEKIYDPAVLLKVPQLYPQFQKAVYTDLTPEQIQSLACLANKIQLSQVEQTTFAREKVDIHPDDSIWIKDMAEAKQTVLDFFAK